MLLNNLLIMSEKIPITDALLYALIGFALVFVGIGILIGVLYLLGFIMQKTGGTIKIKIPNPFKRKKKAEEEAKEEQADLSVPAAPVAAKAESEEVPDEVKAAIVAALMAYYSVEKPKCEFVIKKIKRI